MRLPDSAGERGLIQEEFGASLAQLLQQLPPSWRCSDEIEGSGRRVGATQGRASKERSLPWYLPLGPRAQEFYL